MKRKEEWINDVFNSIEGIKRASPPNDLFIKVESLLSRKGKNYYIPIRKLSWSVAAAIFLIAINIYSISSSMKINNKEKEGFEQLQILTDFTLY